MLLLVVHCPHEMLDLRDHAAGRRRVRQFGHATDLVETQSDQRFALAVVTADCAAGLLHLDQFASLAHIGLPKHLEGQSVAGSPSPTSRRRACRADTLMLRRAATERGESWCFTASKGART